MGLIRVYIGEESLDFTGADTSETLGAVKLRKV
jgi:hypothetical protein